MQSVLQRQKPKAFQGPRNCCAKGTLEPKNHELLSAKEIKKSEDHYQKAKKKKQRPKENK